jgi:hypothetical protein
MRAPNQTLKKTRGYGKTKKGYLFHDDEPLNTYSRTQQELYIKGK